MKTRYDQMEEQAQTFHKKHPEIWKLFKQFTFEKIKVGFKNYGARNVIERIRWETDKPNKVGANTFKINNNFHPFYARAFMNTYPEHKGFFRTRVQKSKDAPATNLPDLTPADYPYTNE
jgi:hypothetical protein